MFVFVLECQHYKYVVGKTNDPDFTVAKYLSTTKQSHFTTQNEPIKVVELIPNCDAFDVNKYTKKYMAKYGIYNVQGGSYSDYIDEDTYLALEKELEFTTEKKCLVCGEDHDGTCDEINLDTVKLTYNDCKFIHNVLTKISIISARPLINSYARIFSQYVDVVEKRVADIKKTNNVSQSVKDAMGDKKSRKKCINKYTTSYKDVNKNVVDEDPYEKSNREMKTNISIYKKIIECYKELVKPVEDRDLDKVDSILQKLCKYYNLLPSRETNSNVTGLEHYQRIFL